MDSDKGGCCPPGSEPFLAATYKPKGEVIKLDDLECYVYGKGDKAVICSYDIYGFDAGRTRLMVDQIADAGYLAILPDYYRGVKWGADDPIGPDTFKWILDFTWEKVWKDITDKVLPYLAEKGATKIGLTGTCWGAWVVLKACTTDKFACGVSWHPSFHCEKLFGGNEEEVAEKVKAPQIIMPAGGDQANVMEDGALIKILKNGPHGSDLEYRHFKDVAHGYMTRSDLEKEENKLAVKEGMELALAFLAKHLK